MEWQKFTDPETGASWLEPVQPQLSDVGPDLANTSAKHQLTVISAFPRAIQYVLEPTEEMQLVAVKHRNATGEIFKYIRNPTDVVRKAAIDNIPSLVFSMGIVSDEIARHAISRSSGIMRQVLKKDEIKAEDADKFVGPFADPSEDLILYTIGLYPDSVVDVANPTEEMWLLAAEGFDPNKPKRDAKDEKLFAELVYMKTPVTKAKILLAMKYGFT